MMTAAQKTEARELVQCAYPNNRGIRIARSLKVCRYEDGYKPEEKVLEVTCEVIRKDKSRTRILVYFDV